MSAYRDSVFKGIAATVGVLAVVFAVVVVLILNSGGEDRPAGSPDGDATTYDPADDLDSMGILGDDPTHEDPADDTPINEGESVDDVPAGPASSFGDGTYEVGVDVRPGRYRNGGDTYDGQAPCVAYTSRKPNDLTTYVTGSTSKGPGILDVARGLFLTVQGCQEWTRSPGH